MAENVCPYSFRELWHGNRADSPLSGLNLYLCCNSSSTSINCGTMHELPICAMAIPISCRLIFMACEVTLVLVVLKQLAIHRDLSS